MEIQLPFKLERPVLAVGAQMKNAIALGWDDRVILSPHIGEMDSPRSLETFKQCIENLQALYQVKVEAVVCDAHPGYTPSRWAHQSDLPVLDVYHHHAHAAAVYADAMQADETLTQMLVFTWDGVGLGPDGSLWGGDALLGHPGQWQRVAHFRPFHLPGGERAGREPWRSAAALCWEADRTCSLEPASDPLLFSFWQQRKNAPQTNAAGRLFDAAAALSGVCSKVSFEGQGPMQLEALAATHGNIGDSETISLPINQTQDGYIVDWAPLLVMLTDEAVAIAERAARFHLSMANSLLAQAEQVREDTGVTTVGLAGGVFQNRILTEKCIELLTGRGFQVSFPEMVPVNDGGISFGQIVEFYYHRKS